MHLSLVVLKSIEVLNSELDPTFYHYQIFLKVTNFKDVPLQALNSDKMSQYPLFLFVTSLLYQSLVHESDFYIDKSFILKNPCEVEQEILRTIPIIRDGDILQSVNQLMTNIRLIKSQSAMNSSSNEAVFLLSSSWPSESKVIRLVRLNSKFNKFLPIKQMNSKIMNVLVRLERNFNYNVPFDDFVGVCYESAISVIQAQKKKGRKRVLAENITLLNMQDRIDDKESCAFKRRKRL